MRDKLTPDELAALPPKARRDATVVQLYAEHDYLTAYGLHTDRRVLTTGAQDAAGADASRDNWNSHGQLQLDFLIQRGLRSNHTLLDVGCGGGRLARKAAPYLMPGQYHGVDLSAAAVASAEQLSKVEGWNRYHPKFWFKHVPASLSGCFDFVWAHSVTTHLAPIMIEDLFTDVAELLSADGSFYWSYLPAEQNERYGLMQFRTTVDTLRGCAERAGLTFEDVPDWVESAGHVPGRWTYGQRVALSVHAP